MVKKAQGGPGQNGKPMPIPNKEIIQRMNFLQQAATLISGAIQTPAPLASTSTSKPSDIQSKSAKHHKKHKEKLSRSKFLSQVDVLKAEQGLTYPLYGQAVASFMDPPTTTALPMQYHPERPPQIKHGMSSQRVEKLKIKHADYRARLYWAEKGLTEQEVEVKINRKKKRILRKIVKDEIGPLQIGILPVSSSRGFTSASKKVSAKERKGMKTQNTGVKHPSHIDNRSLATHYVNDIRTMAKKNVLRLDPNVKRNLCRNCNALLIPGLTSKVKIQPSKTHVHRIQTQCLACNVTRMIPSPPILQDTSAQLQGGEAGAMQEDITPSSTTPVSSRTLSEVSADKEDGNAEDTSMMADERLGKDSEKPPKADAKPSTTSKKEVPKRQRPSQKGKKRNWDSVVPGTKKQYKRLRFHERPEHTIVSLDKQAKP